MTAIQKKKRKKQKLWINCIYEYASNTSGLPGWLNGKESVCNAGVTGSIPGWEDPLEKETTIHSRILDWEILSTLELGRLQSMGLQKSWT